GNVVGHENIVSASRMNSAIVVFLNDVEKVRKLTQNGIVGNNETILVSPLSSPVKKVMLSNVPPFISDEAIGKELSRYGRMVSPIKKIPLGSTGAGRGRAGRGRSLCGRGPAAEGPGAAAAPDLTESEPQAQPAAQKPTGATPAPEKPRTAEPAAAEPRSARPDRKKPWSTEKSSVGSGAVLEPPALTEAGRRVYRGIRQGCSLPAYADDLVVMVASQEDVNVLAAILNDFRILSSAKVNWTKSEAILVGEWGGGQPSLPGGLAWKSGFKYLGVYLGTNEFLNKNWEGSVEHMKGRLSRWKRLVPKMSYRGRTLVINNLTVSSLCHKLACMDPPPNLLANIQALLVDFFWDNLHWITQSVLHVPKEEGGQGLVQLSSRAAAFRLQFIQRLLTGPRDLV
ncbi:hypothetical protein QTP86_030058, partial [Hemibagrus guttatus]